MDSLGQIPISGPTDSFPFSSSLIIKLTLLYKEVHCADQTPISLTVQRDLGELLDIVSQ